jgi:NAD(P)-dependent dehydrogenase (short-subunit alcohol dehydrogenase family)
MQTLFLTGSSGMAAATARLWVQRGGRVFLAGLVTDECDAFTQELDGAAAYSVCNVADAEAVKRAVEQCRGLYGRIDAVFNAAGISARRFGDGPLHECTDEGWQMALSVNAQGVFHVCREVLGGWVREGCRGAIVNMGSVLARRPERDRFATHAYAASKGAVESLTISAAAYYATMGIRLNVLAPGLVATPMSARAQSDPEILEYIARKQPLPQGLLDAEQVARAAVFLLSDESASITGQVIRVDGGWCVS